ncbi:MAG TPA: DegT/DnrJ/EryC1/StrS family aminotransferase, partial [Pirellulaceae bacterium]|nr:DegT/DnrJ/EryC1/StrS family aminotransferase [Pirellulaceae bacterium]
ALDDRVRAVVPVHFAGQACEMDAIERLVRDRCPRATIIEDACHAIGGTYRDGTPNGSPRYASMVVFSFHPVKHIAAGEGGAVTTSSRQLKEQLEQFRCHGMTKDPEQLRRPDEGPWYYEMHSPGFNYRIPEAACALASSQLAKLQQSVAQRRKIVAKYHDELGGIEHLSLPPRSHLKTSAWHLFCLHIDYPALGRSRTDVMASLKDRGVGTQVHYYPVSLQPYYQDRYRHTEAQFPGAVSHYRRELSIPLFPSMTAAEVEQVVSAVRHVLTSKSNVKRQVA